MGMTVQRREELQLEIKAFMDLYNEAFVSGTREDLQALVHLPVIYVSETETQIRDRYPFDPERMLSLIHI